MTDWPFDGIRPFSFDLILADPPWHFELRSEAGEAKSPQAHYDTMTVDEMAAIAVARLEVEGIISIELGVLPDDDSVWIQLRERG